MKKYSVVLILLLFVCVNTYSQELTTLNSNTKAAEISWEKKVFDFGELKQGIPVSTEFTFKNSGSDYLIIDRVSTSCGCTATDYPKEPIAPEGSATIKVKYNAKSKGAFNKSITIYSNDKASSSVLRIKGSVI